MRYPALIDGTKGAYGVVFPDLPGCLAMGETIDEAIHDAQEALAQWMDAADERGITIAEPSALEDVEVPEGSALTSILLVRAARNRPAVRVNLYLDAGVADAINSETNRRGITRKDYIEEVVRMSEVDVSNDKSKQQFYGSWGVAAGIVAIASALEKTNPSFNGDLAESIEELHQILLKVEVQEGLSQEQSAVVDDTLYATRELLRITRKYEYSPVWGVETRQSTE